MSVISLPNRFEIEQKLKHAKKLEQKKKEKGGGSNDSASMNRVVGMVASKRSQERRKDLESKKDSKKMTAMQELKARREEKKVRGRNKEGKRFQLIINTCRFVSSVKMILCKPIMSNMRKTKMNTGIFWGDWSKYNSLNKLTKGMHFCLPTLAFHDFDVFSVT